MNTLPALSQAEIRRRWPRLLWALRWSAMLSEEQALSVLILYKLCAQDRSMIEAVSARGGNRAVIRAAIRGRRGARRARRNGERTRIREKALQAFWCVVTEGYPQVRHASLPYDAAIDLLLAADAAIDRCVGPQPQRDSARS